jgi:hypothetical protein
MNGEFALTRKETFSVSMVIFIGFFYLLSLASALFQTRSIPLNRLFGVTEIRYLFLGIFYWSGAISFFKIRKWGWVICTATLLNFIVIVSQLVISVSQSSKFNGYAAIVISSFVLVVAAFIFFFSKETRIKFMVNNKTYLFVIVVYGMLLAITFF